ncbi:importin subunit beta-1-like [Rhopilema esculentum]|uniref:importin subunit beta-1-like n=1 Tax=Rhopilema esculentum TaxID=499914 RepID=UPI0031DE7BAB|eukprot:gene13528-4411_t
MDLEIITKALEATVSQDKNELEAAQKYLEQCAQGTGFPHFLFILSTILSDRAKSPVARMAAGLQLKNCLTSKDPNVKQQHQQRWFSIDENARSQIKVLVLRALGTETDFFSAAQCVASIAAAELPQNGWIDLLPTLLANVENAESTYQLKEASLEAIGYMCQDIDAQYLEKFSGNILQAIAHGMKDESPNTNVKFHASNSLLNSLEFIRANFEKKDQRDFIMEVVCNATQSAQNKVKVVALQCLVKIVSLYYDFMEAYMGPALFRITVDAMRSEEDEISLQGIEFWSSLCDEEIDLSIEAAEAAETNTPPERFSHFYAKGALAHLVPILFNCLTKQEEFDDEDDWNPSKAAGVCLMLLATCTTNDIVNHVLPFIHNSITSSNWKQRDAAVMAFGCILEGPEAEALKPVVLQAMPVLLGLMKDPSVVVRDSVAWTLSRVCEQVPEAALDGTNLDNLLNALMENLDSEPRVSTNVCWAFSSLAEAAYDSTQTAEEDEPQTYILSGKFKFIVQKLIDTAERQDACQSNLRSAAYEAVMELIKNSPKDCYDVVKTTVVSVLDRISRILQMESAGSNLGDHSQHNDFKSLLCAVLQSGIRKFTPDDAAQVGDAVMQALLQMLSATKAGGVQEDAFMALGTLIEGLGDRFAKYIQAFKPFLIEGLGNRSEYQVCIAATGVVGDLCRALGAQILPLCDEIMTKFGEGIADQTVHRSVKPHIISAFGDVALAIGTEYRKYAEPVLLTLAQAAAAPVDMTDYDMIDFVNELRESCLEAFTSIVQGLKGEDEKNISPEVKIVEPHVGNVMKFIEIIAQDPDRTDSLIGACCGLIGDLCSVFGSAMVPIIDNQVYQDLMQEARRSKVQKTKTLAVWASRTLRNLKK